MQLNFKELDYQQTPLGELILQQRDAVEVDGRAIVEVKLNQEYLMTSLFSAGEIALTNLGLSALKGENWDIVVGGLGLGFTAAQALKYAQVKRMVIVEALAPVIEWHCKGIVSNGRLLTDDPRCIYHNADFFELARTIGFDPEISNHQFDAILLDIDHTPDTTLNQSHNDFYTAAGIRRLAAFIKPDGIFALWSNKAPTPAFTQTLSTAFSSVEGHTVEFPNPIQNTTAINGVYVAIK